MKANRHDTERILESLQSMKRAEAPPFLQTRIEAKIYDQRAYEQRAIVDRVRLGIAGFAFACLLLINLALLGKHPEPKNSIRLRPSASQSYELNNEKFDLY